MWSMRAARKGAGFTLIELLIVIGIISVLAAIIFVAVDPARRFAEARNAQRWSEANAVLNSILKCTVDNNGTLPSALGSATATPNVFRMIGNGTDFSGCTAQATTEMLNLRSSNCEGSTYLVPDYLAQLPVDPSGGTWTQARTGYYIVRTSAGRITIGACTPERSETISVTR
mgnify:CR=1 FL=1